MDSGGYRGPVADLVDPYTTKDTVGEAVESLAGWLRAHPGRWAMFGEGEHGFDSKILVAAGFEVAQKTSKLTGVRRTYARLPHPEGEPLSEALARTKDGRAMYPSDLPDLQQDSFNWTKEELELACKTARENLFPVRAGRGSGRKK